MPQNDDRTRDVRDSRIVDPAAETPSRAAQAAGRPIVTRSEAIHADTESERAARHAEVHVDEAPAPDADTLPPPSAHRADTMVRAVAPDARMEMESDGTFGNEPAFTKGDNAPTIDQSRYPYTVQEMDALLTEAPRGLFPDTPGGDGATPLSADRNDFLATMGERGHFPSQAETERWARAVFNALRQRAIEQDDALATEFKSVVRFGEAPEVQVEEMMWGGDYIDRMRRALPIVRTSTRQEFYQQVAEEAGETIDDPWVDAAVHSFLGTLKTFLGDEADGVGNLGELQEIWDRV